VRFTIRSQMLAVAATALMLGLAVGGHRAWLVLMEWLSPPQPPPGSTNPVFFGSSISMTLNFGGYEIPHTSPIFWVITAILMASVIAIVAGVIAAFVWAARILNKPGRRNV
jgi:hypothetical protein